MILSKLICKVWFKTINLFILEKNHVQYGKFNIVGRIRIYREHPLIEKCPKTSIFIGDRFGCNSGLKYNPIGGDTCTILRTIDNGTIVIGNNGGMSNATLVAWNKIEIEDDVTIGGGVKIYDNDFHSLNYQLRVFRPYDDIASRPVKICKGAFIGAGSYILKGVTIGEKSVIGAGSVVSKDIPAGEVWAGNPVRFIKKINNKRKCFPKVYKRYD